jgi:hypothetical protein
MPADFDSHLEQRVVGIRGGYECLGREPCRVNEGGEGFAASQTLHRCDRKMHGAAFRRRLALQVARVDQR